jgi:hypothetical protein
MMGKLLRVDKKDNSTKLMLERKKIVYEGEKLYQ